MTADAPTPKVPRPPPQQPEPMEGDGFTQQLRELNEALLLSSVRQHELADEAGRAKVALEAANQRLEAIVDNAPFGLYLLDAKLRFRHVSRRTRSVFGDIGELIGRDFAEVVHIIWPADASQHILARFRQTLNTGEPYVSSEFTDVRYDLAVREYYDWEIHRLVLPDGQFGVVCYFVDVSQRVLAEESSRRSTERLRFVIDSMPQKIMTATAGGVIDYVNPQWTQYTGASSEQITDGGWKQFVHADDLAETERLWTQSVHTGQPFELEHRFRKSDGEYCWHLSRLRAFRDSDERIVMWIGSHTDIHEQRQSADELRRFADDLSDADTKKNQFLALVAHELRNPLAPIRNAVQILHMASGNEESVRLATRIMDRQVSQMERLVNDLLEVNRFNLGKTTLRIKLIELASVVHQAVEAVEPVRGNLGHELQVNLPSAPIFLYADPTRLTQVLENLLTNACKFTPPFGRIALTATLSDGEVSISVQDNGIGLSPEHIQQVFTLFAQIDSPESHSAGGLGIGLSLVKNLIAMHGGTVVAESGGLGHGSTFTVRLPNVVEVPPLASAATGDESPAATSARRILIVDDNRDTAQSLAVLFEWFGNETQVAHDGLDAVEAALMFRPDVILLDIGLPGISGYEACRRIRASVSGEGTAIIALTGLGEAGNRERALDAGFDDHVVKPVVYADLDRILSRVMATKPLNARGDNSTS